MQLWWDCFYSGDLFLAVGHLIFYVADFHDELKFYVNVIVKVFKINIIQRTFEKSGDLTFAFVYAFFERFGVIVLPLKIVSFLLQWFLKVKKENVLASIHYLKREIPYPKNFTLLFQDISPLLLIKLTELK